jgi:hypothetical protein
MISTKEGERLTPSYMTELVAEDIEEQFQYQSVIHINYYEL